MQITLRTSENNLIISTTDINKANEAEKAVFKRQYLSDIYYSLNIKGLEQSGSIDLEPRMFWQREQNEIVSKHFNTYFGNISKLEPNKAPYFFTIQDIEHFTKLFTLIQSNN